jgi:hypothetical protein
VKPKDELAGLLPPPPPERRLPHQPQHKADLLAAIAAEPARGQGFRRAATLRSPRASGWLVPAFAAVAVTAVAVAALTLSLTVFGKHVSPQPTSKGHSHSHSHPPGPAPSGKLTTTRHWQVPSAGLRNVVLRTNVGAITVTGDNSGRPVAVTAQPTYQGAAPVVSSKVTGGVLTVSAFCPEHNGNQQCMVTVRVSLPRSLPVRASSKVSTVAVAGLTGSVTVIDDVGPIQLSHLAGPVTAVDSVGPISGYGLVSRRVVIAAHVGRIDVSFAAVPDRVDASNQEGSVAITVPASGSYRVFAKSQLGIVTVTVPRSASSTHVIDASSRLGLVTVTG